MNYFISDNLTVRSLWSSPTYFNVPLQSYMWNIVCVTGTFIKPQNALLVTYSKVGQTFGFKKVKTYKIPNNINIEQYRTSEFKNLKLKIKANLAGCQVELKIKANLAGFQVEDERSTREIRRGITFLVSTRSPSFRVAYFYTDVVVLSFFQVCQSLVL